MYRYAWLHGFTLFDGLIDISQIRFLKFEIGISNRFKICDDEGLTDRTHTILTGKGKLLMLLNKAERQQNMTVEIQSTAIQLQLRRTHSESLDTGGCPHRRVS